MANNVEKWKEGGFFDSFITKPLHDMMEKVKKQKAVDDYKKMDKDNKIDDTKLYGWGKEKLTKQEVMELVGWIPSPYWKEFVDRIENGDIKWLQQFLNGIIDKLGLFKNLAFKKTLEDKGIWLKDGKHILEDWKLWPQTMETLKFLAENRNFFEQLGDVYWPRLKSKWKSITEDLFW